MQRRGSRTAARDVPDRAGGEGGDLRPAAGAVHAAVRLEPVRQRLRLLLVPRQQPRAGAQGAQPGGDRLRGPRADGRGPQARAAGRRRGLSARGLRLHPAGDRHDLRSGRGLERDPARQRERRAAGGRAVPAAEGTEDRHLPDLPGDLRPPRLRRGAPARTQDGLRLAARGDGPGLRRRHRRRGAWECCSGWPTGASNCWRCSSTSSTWSRASASGRTRSACRGWSRPRARAWPAIRRTRWTTRASARSWPSCA